MGHLQLPAALPLAPLQLIESYDHPLSLPVELAAYAELDQISADPIALDCFSSGASTTA